MKKIQKEHVALIIKYTWISFITGWISHGFFSWERQIITSLVWIGLFIVWTLLEQDSWEKEYLRTIILSAILAVAIGALTWWLQHFPDSPGRSVWIIPLGFIFSVYAFLALEKKTVFKKEHLIYAWVWFALFIGLSLLLFWLVHKWYLWGGEWGHGHGEWDSHTEEHTDEHSSNHWH